MAKAIVRALPEGVTVGVVEKHWMSGRGPRAGGTAKPVK